MNPLFIIPTEFSQCVTFYQQLILMLEQIEKNTQDIEDLKARVEALENNT